MTKKDKDFNRMLTIIYDKMGVDPVNDKRRFKHIVNAKRIYSYMLHKQGYGCSVISKSINMDHATVLHYLRNIDEYLKSYTLFREQYLVCKEAFDNWHSLDYDAKLDGDILKNNSDKTTIENKLLRVEIEKQRKELNRLSNVNQEQAQHIKGFLVTIKENKYTQDNLFPLYNIIKDRTTRGTEEEMYYKINRLYN